MLLVMVLGVVEVAFALYARNVVAAAAHEGARAAIEVGRDPQDAAVTARSTVEHSAGGLVTDLQVTTAVSAGEHPQIRVVVSGVLKPFGPVPLPLHFSSTATARLPERDL